MPILSASKSHDLLTFTLLPQSSVGIVFCSAYDLFLTDYQIKCFIWQRNNSLLQRRIKLISDRCRNHFAYNGSIQLSLPQFSR